MQQLKIHEAICRFVTKVLSHPIGETSSHSDVLGQTTVAFFHEGCTDRFEAMLKEQVVNIKARAVRFGFSFYKEIDGMVETPFDNEATMYVLYGQHRLYFSITHHRKGNGVIVFTVKSKYNTTNVVMMTEDERTEDAITILLAMFENEVKHFNMFLSAPFAESSSTNVAVAEPVKAEEPVPAISEFKGTIPPDIWLPGEHLAPLAQAIQRYIKETDSGGWLTQGRELGCQTKYLNIRVDQRTGHFVVSGDSVPTIHIDHNYPDHMYPRGWDSKCKMNPMILQLVIDTNQLVDRKVTNQQIRNQVGNVENWLQEMVGRRVLEISSKKAITGTELMKYYGKKS